MKRSKSDILFTVFKLLILLVITLYLAYSILLMATTEQETGWEALGFVVLLALGIYVNGGALLLSLLLLAVAAFHKASFRKKTAPEAEGYALGLRRKSRHLVHCGLLCGYAVAAELAIFLVGSLIF